MATLKGTWVFNKTITKLANTGVGVAVFSFNTTLLSGDTVSCDNMCEVHPDNGQPYLRGNSTYPLYRLYDYDDEVWWIKDRAITITSEVATDIYGNDITEAVCEWLTTNTTQIDSKTKVFKKLYSGATVATSGTRVFKKLTTEDPTPLPITDLTGTIWTNSIFDAQAGYGEFDVDVKFRNKYELDTTIFDKLSIGYDAEAAAEKSICLYGADGTTKTIKSGFLNANEYTFTGGTDATNKRLISWVLENFTLVQHPEIVGTWVFNDTIAELPIFDDTFEDAYEDGTNKARFVRVNLATSVGTRDATYLYMCNLWADVDENGTESGNYINDEALVSKYLTPLPIYNYETKKYLGLKTTSGNIFLSNNAKNEITILGISQFTNYSGVDVSDKFYAWLTANAKKKFEMAGLYDANDNLVASWDTLVNTYGMDVEKDYTSDTYNTDPASPYCVLTNNAELAAGKKIVIADGITSVGATAFRDCNNLTNIILPNSVTSIGGAAFYNCTGLTSFTFPNGVTSFGVASFQGCTSLVSIIIPDGVLSISLGAFYGCASLTSVTIPRSVTSIGNGAFNVCSSLNNVYYQGAEEQWAVISIGQFNTYLTNATIHYNYTG